MEKIEQPPKILLIDDNEQNRYIVARILKKNGLEVEECATGQEGITAMANHPDLVILDVKLPDISGFEVCRRIKQDPRLAALPVLQISASFVSNESKAMALEGGADGYLTHPIDSIVLMATVRSLLRLRNAEQLSRHSAEQWQSAFDTLSEGIALLDAEDQVVRCNLAFARICRSEFPEMIGKDAVAILEKSVGTASFLQRKHSHRLVEEVKDRCNWFRVTVDPMASDGLRVGSIVVLNDVTERRIAEESLRNSERLAATARMALLLAHEVNNPLAALVNLVYLAKHSSKDPAVTEYLELATAELDRVTRISKQVLTFHCDTDEPIELDMGELLDAVLMLFTAEIAAKSLQLDFQRNCAQTVCGFPSELRHVFSNLVGNAIEATPAGGRLIVRLHSAERNGKAGTRITVADSGSGIAKEIRPHIFEPFFTTKDTKGAGLGLWVTARLVAKNGGAMKMRSSVGGRQGNCFSVFFPAAKSQPSKH